MFGNKHQNGPNSRRERFAPLLALHQLRLHLLEDEKATSKASNRCERRRRAGIDVKERVQSVKTVYTPRLHPIYVSKLLNLDTLPRGDRRNAGRKRKDF
jgi:hypothetical protein